MMILLTSDKKLTKSQLSPTHAATKRKITEGWWEGFVEQVRFKSGMEERGSDGWCDVCYR